VVEAGESLLVEPQTYMNRSGAAVRCLAERYEIGPDRILVLYDEVHLPLGRIRLRPSGSPAGHRGMESVVESLGTEAVPRLRLGVGPLPPGLGEEGLAEFVLAPFPAEDVPAVESIVERAAEAVRVWIESGIEVAMNRANVSNAPPAPDLPPVPPAS
jgi:peptidyl-tRNA hydrolase, PTH1 family